MTEPISDRYRIGYELVSRKHILASKLKCSASLAYAYSWVAKQLDEAGEWKPVRCFEAEQEAIDWVNSEASGVPVTE